MIAFIIRGVFLLGIISWYSTNVWKLIDVYFKDQFEKYLQEEFRKNPRMKSDIESVRSTDKAAPPGTPEVFPGRVGEEVRSAEGECPISSEDAYNPPVEKSISSEPAATSKAETCDTDAGESGPGETALRSASENGAVKGAADKNAFPGASASASARSADGSGGAINQADETARKSEVSNQRSSPRSVNERRAPDQGRRSIASRRSAARNPNEKKFKIVTLTRADFASVQGKRRKVIDDFWEFEENDEEDDDDDDREEMMEKKKKSRDGILVADLPFKPRADIGDLDRVSPEEYCPLTLEDEVTCGETVEWP